MKKIIVAALSVVLVVSVTLYFGSSTTGLFYAGDLDTDSEEDFSEVRSPKWEIVGKVDVRTGNVSVLAG